MFYDTLNGKSCSSKIYLFAKLVWKEMECKKLDKLGDTDIYKWWCSATCWCF